MHAGYVKFVALTFCLLSSPSVAQITFFSDAFFNFIRTMMRVTLSMLLQSRNIDVSSYFLGLSLHNTTDYIRLTYIAAPDLLPIVINTLASSITLHFESFHTNFGDKSDEWYKDPRNNPYDPEMRGYGAGGDVGVWAATSQCWGVERLLSFLYTITATGRLWHQDHRTWPDPVTDYNRVTFFFFNSKHKVGDRYISCKQLHYNSRDQDFEQLITTGCFSARRKTRLIIPGLIDRYRPNFWHDVSREKCASVT